mmetsp:Transcript_80089/g.179229  ORF Transcript_80089/g.179229 Transcript_80089/m.179229 type:complete len:361 (-) Transcript_80089:70-1152(-)
MADGRFDDLLLGLASKHKDVEELSHSVLSFFERRTDLFHVMETGNERMGFMPGVAEKMFFKHFHFFQHKYWSRTQPHILDRLAEQTRVAAGEAGTEADATGGAAGSEAQPSQPAGGGGQEPREAQPAHADKAEPSAPSEETQSALPEKTRKMMRHISTWNGAVTDKYYWSQSLSEVTLEVEVEECRAKDIEVSVTSTRLCIKCKGKTVLEGKLHEKVTSEETIWHLEENKQVVLSLEKGRETWWKCVLEGDEEIDTTKVESTRSMEEYDGETQGAIRKIMFDQNQKVQGKPTSDQIRTADIMKDAWNAPGSPFRGTEFDPTLLNLSGPVPDDFFEDLEKKKIEESRKAMEGGGVPPDGSG